MAQHAVLTLAQLKGLGLSGRAVQHRARSGHLHRIHRGVYALVPPSLLSREGRWLAAVLACGPGAALSHRTAAALLELHPSHGALIDVTVPGHFRSRRPGLRIHRSTTLSAASLTVVRGIPCTTVARTTLDLCEVVPRRTVERACDQAEILGLLDLRALREELEANRGRRSSRTLKSILDEHYVGQTATWSELEERFLALVREAGLPEPQVNAFVDPGDGEPPVRVDFVWREQRVIVETDGHQSHRTRQAFERDRRRDQRLVAAGWRVIRVTWRQLIGAPSEVTRTLLLMLAAR